MGIINELNKQDHKSTGLKISFNGSLSRFYEGGGISLSIRGNSSADNRVIDENVTISEEEIKDILCAIKRLRIRI